MYTDVLRSLNFEKLLKNRRSSLLDIAANDFFDFKTRKLAKEISRMSFFELIIEQDYLTISIVEDAQKEYQNRIDVLNKSHVEEFNKSLVYNKGIYYEYDLMQKLTILKNGKYIVVWYNESDDENCEKNKIKEIWVKEIKHLF